MGNVLDYVTAESLVRNTQKLTEAERERLEELRRVAKATKDDGKE